MLSEQIKEKEGFAVHILRVPNICPQFEHNKRFYCTEQIILLWGHCIILHRQNTIKRTVSNAEYN